jgi:formate dehydrogenase iron-sulfur subunit
MAKGFFTDTTLCIGCKACEVACKEWNLLPEDGLQGQILTGTFGSGVWEAGAAVNVGESVTVSEPDYDTLPLEHFEERLRAVFATPHSI